MQSTQFSISHSSAFTEKSLSDSKTSVPFLSLLIVVASVTCLGGGAMLWHAMHLLAAGF